MPALVSTLQVMAATHDVSPLLRYLLPHLVHSEFAGQSGETFHMWIHNMSPLQRSHQSLPVATITGEMETDRLGVLESVLKSVPLTKDLDRTVAR